MTAPPWHLPWDERTVPHAALDICRGCNITCRACYNAAGTSLRTLADIDADLDRLARARPLSSVTVVGGEVTLHPDLCTVVRHIKARGLAVEVFTNGVLLDAPLCARLRDAGTDIVYLHIEPGQARPDLADPASPDAIRALREAKIALLAAHGLDVGLVLTLCDHRAPDAAEAVRLTLASPHVHYLLITLYRDVARIRRLSGDLTADDLRGELDPAAPATEDPLLDNGWVAAWMQREFGLHPFGCLGSNLDRTNPRWLSYLVGTVLDRDGRLVAWRGLRTSLFERAFLAAALRLGGRYPMYLPQGALRNRVHLLLNGLAGGALPSNLRLLAAALRPGRRLLAKRLLFQDPAYLAADGRLVHCSPCPDAVLRAGRLVPVCVADRVSEAGPPVAAAAQEAGAR